MALRDPHAAEARRLAGMLASVVRQRGLPRRALAEKLGLSPGELAALFGGSADLSLARLLQILQALDIQPLHFFRIAFGRPPRRCTESDGAPLAEEELTAILLEGLPPLPEAEVEVREEDLLTAEGSAGPDPAPAVREIP